MGRNFVIAIWLSCLKIASRVIGRSFLPIFSSIQQLENFVIFWVLSGLEKMGRNFVMARWLSLLKMASRHTGRSFLPIFSSIQQLVNFSFVWAWKNGSKFCDRNLAILPQNSIWTHREVFPANFQFKSTNWKFCDFLSVVRAWKNGSKFCDRNLAVSSQNGI